MSTKVRSITILFDKDVTEEYIDMIKQSAICYKHVLTVEQDVESIADWAIETRIKSEMHKKLFDIVHRKDD